MNLKDFLSIIDLPDRFILGADVALLFGLAVNVELLAEVHSLNVLKVSSGDVLVLWTNIILIIDPISIIIKQTGISSLNRFSSLEPLTFRGSVAS